MLLVLEISQFSGLATNPTRPLTFLAPAWGPLGDLIESPGLEMISKSNSGNLSFDVRGFCEHPRTPSEPADQELMITALKRQYHSLLMQFFCT